MDNPRKVIKIMNITTIIVGILAIVCALTMFVTAGWINILAATCCVACAFIAMVQLLLVKQAYIGVKDPDDE